MPSIAQGKQAVKPQPLARVKCCDCDASATHIAYTGELHWRFCCRKDPHGKGTHFYAVPLAELNTVYGLLDWLTHLETTKNWFAVSRPSWNERLLELMGRKSHIVSPTHPFEDVMCVECGSPANRLKFCAYRRQWMFLCSRDDADGIFEESNCQISLDRLKDAHDALEWLRHLEREHTWFPQSREAWYANISRLLGETNITFHGFRMRTAAQIHNEWADTQKRAQLAIQRRVDALRELYSEDKSEHDGDI